MPPLGKAIPVLPSLFSGRVTEWDAVVSLDGSNGRAVTLKVSLLNPIKKRSSVVINVNEQRTNADATWPPNGEIGAQVTAITKDDVHILATVTSAEMTALLALATGNRLKSCLLACTEPYRGRAHVDMLRLGTQEPEDLG
ncbi:hypothetical protein [Acidovorax kalamii]|uniref:hypothetical protein n=1 Tax=Acidovorax kalamii TaxID=2004485 RepID=UPI002090B8E9|nr:hypothetical protein [Acidovorax kalamii]MCO5358425.1 hypothetical protein [Acidovorax kalamii]